MLINCTDFNGTEASGKCNITSGPSPRMHSALMIAVFSTIYGLISVIALIGNTLVCFIIIKIPSMRTVVNAFLFNLAISDIMFIIVTVPGYLVLLLSPTWPLGEAVCKAIPFLNTVTLSASIYTMVALAIDRYNAIVHPLRVKATHTVKRATIVITLIWILSAVVAFPQILTMRIIRSQYCVADWSRMNRLLGKRIYQVTLFVIFFALPVTVITIAYVAIIKRMRKSDALLKDAVQMKEEQTNETTDLTKNEKMQPVSRRKRKSLFMMLTVIIAFLVCMLPFNVLLLVYSFLVRGSYDEGTLERAWQVLVVLSVCSSACNPIIYNFFSDKFRRAFTNVFKCRCRFQGPNGKELFQFSMHNSSRNTSF